MFRRRLIKPVPAGYQIKLGNDERDLLGSLVPQLRDLLGRDDPLTRRLFPTAYHNDPERDAEYRILARSELTDKRLASLELFETTLHADIVTGEELTAWMGSINDVRLVLGTRLDVSEDLESLDDQDPDAPAFAMYSYLGWVLENVVAALAESLPEGDDSMAPE